MIKHGLRKVVAYLKLFLLINKRRESTIWDFTEEVALIQKAKIMPILVRNI